MPNVQPSPMDLASLWGCKNWLGLANSTNAQDDANLQACITAASIFFLRATGRGPFNWQNTTQNPFNEPVDYQETYDGITGEKLFLRNAPINSLASVKFGGTAVPLASQNAQSGIDVDANGEAIYQKSPAYGGRAIGYPSRYGPIASGMYRPFAQGVQGIEVSYNAGYQLVEIVDDLETITKGWQPNTAYSTGDTVSDGTWIQIAQSSGISGASAPAWQSNATAPTPDGSGNTQFSWVNSGVLSAPNMIVILADPIVLEDDGVKFFSDGTALTKVNIAPNAGEYYLVEPGTYLFNVADAGKQVLLSYGLAGTPADIIVAIFQMVGLNYKRRNWIGIRSLAMKDVGSTTYSMDLDKSIKDVIQNYKRTVIYG